MQRYLQLIRGPPPMTWAPGSPRCANATGEIMRQIREAIVHCSASTFGSAAVIDEWHKERGWSGIGYHFVICNGSLTKGEYDPELDGLVQYGRGIERAGAHAKGHNSHSIGICLIGVRSFTGKQLLALKQLLLQLMERYCLTPDDIHCHYEYNHSKTCPNLDVDLVQDLVRYDYDLSDKGY